MLSFWQGFAIFVAIVVVYFLVFKDKKGKENDGNKFEDFCESAGKGIKKFRKAVKEPLNEVKKSVNEEVEETKKVFKDNSH